MRLRPLGNRVLVIPDAPRTHTDSGLELPQDRYEPDVSGVVAAVGPGCAGDVAVGEHVAFSPHVGQVTVFEGTKYLILREDEIAAGLEA